MFSSELEEEFALFMKHCDLLRIPRSRADLKEDIVHYVNVKQLSIKKLQDDGPGSF